MGDTDTGLQATGATLREAKAEAADRPREDRLGAAGNRRTDARDVGCSIEGDFGEPVRRNPEPVVPGGASRPDRRIAQASNGTRLGVLSGVI